MVISLFFHPFGHTIILPHHARIHSGTQVVKILNNGISYPVIPKVIARRFGNFFSEICRISTYLKYDKRFFEQIKIPLHCLLGNTKLIRQFIQRNLMPYLICNKFK